MENITIYYKEHSKPCLQAMKWFEEHNIIVDLKNIDTITQREIFQLIYLSGLDIPDILKKSNMYSFLCYKRKLKLYKLRFSESLSLLERYPKLLEVPIILSNNHALSGYNSEEIGMFLPKVYQK